MAKTNVIPFRPGKNPEQGQRLKSIQYPRLSPEQILAVVDRKNNPVTNRYIAAEIGETRLLKEYPALSENLETPDIPHNTSVMAKTAFTSVNQPPTAKPIPSETVPPIVAGSAPESSAKIITFPVKNQVPPEAKTLSTDINPPVSQGTDLDMQTIRDRINGIHNGDFSEYKSKAAEQINNSYSDTKEQIDQLVAPARDETTKKAA